MFPEPVLLSDGITDKIGVLKYETTAWYKELNEIAYLRNKSTVLMMANINTSLLYHTKFTAVLNSGDSLLVTTRNLEL